jgi:hypothetical protein
VHSSPVNLKPMMQLEIWQEISQQTRTTLYQHCDVLRVRRNVGREVA